MIIRTAERLGQNVLVCAVLISEDAVFGDAAIGEILGLTPRVAAVARLLALRQTNREIAAELRISENTARRYTELALKQLGLKTRFEVRSHLRTAAAAFMASGSR
ncbi:MAG: LuxR C-terminal-related transcriptional regulator [Gemmatimonadota bacterium]